MMSNPTKSCGVVVKVSVITEGDAKVNVQCSELKDCQDMCITEGGLKYNVQSTGLEDCQDMRITEGGLKYNVQYTGLRDCQDMRITEGDDQSTGLEDCLRSMKSTNKDISISFMLSTLLAVVISVGIKVAFPEVDPQMIGGMSMIGFSVSLLVQQWFHSRSLTLSTLLTMVIIVGMKVTSPEVDLLMIGGIAMIGFSVSLMVQQWFSLSLIGFEDCQDKNQEEKMKSHPNTIDLLVPCDILETETQPPSSPFKLMEVKNIDGEVTLYKVKSKTLPEAEVMAAKQYEKEIPLKKADNCYPVTIREVKRGQASQILLEGKPDLPGDENIAFEAVTSYPSKILETETTPASTPVKLMEVKNINGEATLYKIKSETLPEAEEMATKQYEVDMTLKKADWRECDPVTIREIKMSRASQILLEDRPVCPEDEEPTMDCKEDKPVCSGEILEKETTPSGLTIRELKRSHASQIILEDKIVCPGDEEPTKVCEVPEEPTKVCEVPEEPPVVCKEDKPLCPGEEEVISPPSSPVKLVEVKNNKGEVTIYKLKQKKKWNPFKKSHKVIERRSEQHVAEYGPPEEQKPTMGCEVPEEPTKVCEVPEEPTKVCEVPEEPPMVCKEDKPLCPGEEEVSSPPVAEEPTMDFENLTRTKNQLRVSLHMKSFIFSTLLAVIIFVGIKVAFPEVDLQMIGGMSMIGFFVSLLVQQWFISNQSCQCHVLSGEECTCHTLFGIYVGILI